MKTLMPVTATIQEMMAAEDNKLEDLTNKAITDAVSDTFSPFKSKKEVRKVIIEIAITRLDDNLYIQHKVTPKLAPYTEVPDKKTKNDPPQGQIAMDEVIEDAEVIEPEEEEMTEEEMLMEDAEADQTEQAKKKRKKR